jgi:hypothetical protein
VAQGGRNEAHLAHGGVIGLIKLAGGLGDLRITMDGEYSLFDERQTKFCAAVIYQKYTWTANNRRTEIGPPTPNGLI